MRTSRRSIILSAPCDSRRTMRVFIGGWPGRFWPRIGLAERAIEEGRVAVRLDPESAESHHALGVALAQGGQASEAAHEFEETIRLQPNRVEAYGNLAKAYAAADRPQDAIATAETGLNLARSSGEQEAARQIEAWLADFRERQPKEYAPREASPSR